MRWLHGTLALGLAASVGSMLLTSDADARGPKFSIQKPSKLLVGISRDRIMKLGRETKHKRGVISATFETGHSCDYRTNGKRNVYLSTPRTPMSRSGKLGHNIPGSVARWGDVPVATLDELKAACVAGKKYYDVRVKAKWECLQRNGFDSQYENHTRNLRIHLECDRVMAPNEMRARVTPIQYEHKCPPGFAFKSGKTRVLSSSQAAPGQCFHK